MVNVFYDAKWHECDVSELTEILNRRPWLVKANNGNYVSEHFVGMYNENLTLPEEAETG